MGQTEPTRFLEFVQPAPTYRFTQPVCVSRRLESRVHLR